MSAIQTIAKGIGDTFIKVANRILKISHDDTGWIELGPSATPKRLYILVTAITHGVTATTAPAGSLGVTSHATGKSKGFFVSDGSYWYKMSQAGAAITALTDNSGGATADGTIGVVTAPTALTDSTGGSASGTLAAITVTTPADLAAVGTQLGIIRNAIASLAARQAENRTAHVAETDAIKELATKVNAVINA